MKISTFPLSLGLLLVGPTYAQTEVSSCLQQEVIDECAAASRACVASIDMSGEEVCGTCLEGTVEWQSPAAGATPSCVDIGMLNLTAFLEEYSPVYKDEVSPSDRFALLQASATFISDYRAQNPNATFELGLTAWSADTPEEYEQRSGFIYINVTGTENDIPQADLSRMTAFEELPEKVDWVEAGAVTSMKDQGRCVSCWAFSIAGGVEGAAAVNASNGGYLQSLSFQQLISCNDLNYGCQGGSLVLAIGYSWLNLFGGLARNNEYTYSDYRGDTTQECKLDRVETPLAVRISEPAVALDFSPPTGFQTRLETMKRAVAQQPVSMTMKSSCRTFSNYRSGILTDDGDCACSSVECIDHAILMVGYDDTSDPPSWKLKNSWGTGWGEDGYFRVAQTEKGPYGLFGVLSHAVIPQVAYNVTEEVFDEEQDVPMERWAIMLIILACIAACVCFCGTVSKVILNRIEEGGDEKLSGEEDDNQ